MAESNLDRALALGQTLLGQQEEVKRLTASLAAAKEALLRTEREDLPELMRELSLTAFKLQDGSGLDLIDDVDCSITEERRAEAHQWLIDNGFGGLVKTLVTVEFGRGELEEAERFAAEAGALTEHSPIVKESVHASTLKSFVKEQLEKGNAIPFDTFSIRPYSRVKVTAPKKRK